MLSIGGIPIEAPLALGPMAGVTDMAFRTICREQGAALTCTEMVSAKALCYQDKKSIPLLQLGDGEHPAAAQIFGSDPVCMEEAAAIARLLRRYGLSQQQAAEKLGRSQSAVANKLRLLRLEEPVAEALHHYGLTERHARALLRLEDPEQRLAAVEHIGKNQLNVADAEAYIDRLVAQNQTTQPRRRSAYIIKDVRLFLNSVDRGVRLMQTAGVGAKVSRRDTEDAICLTVTIPRAKPQKEVS